MSNVVLAFGAFRLIPQQRMLLRDGAPVEVRNRAWEILLSLVSRAGNVVEKSELMRHAWPNGFAEEATLRVHVAILRKILEDGKDGTRYIENVTGQGYRFVAPVTQVGELMVKANTVWPPHGIPLPPQRIVGREEVLSRIVARMPHRRFMTIVGAGGVGKTALAITVVHGLQPTRFTRVCFADLATVAGPEAVPACIAKAVGVDGHSEDPLAAVVDNLRQQQRALIVLDNCERHVESIAPLVERLLALIPELHILATSREPLRAKGEYVVRLMPLELPPRSATLTVDEALAFPAVGLFIQRATESRDSFEVDASDIPAVVEICRQLDGLPLALELAAARADIFGVQALASNLSDQLRLLTRGPRTAVPRHQTLRAMLDWSYEMLSPAEQAALRRLAVFADAFDTESASAVVADDDFASGDVLDVIMSLATKSLLNSSVSGDSVSFSMLQTSRAYALEKLDACGESERVRRRLARLQQ